MEHALPLDKIEKFAVELEVLFNIEFIVFDSEGRRFFWGSKRDGEERTSRCCAKTIENLVLKVLSEERLKTSKSDYSCSCGSHILRIPVCKNAACFGQTFTIIGTGDKPLTHDWSKPIVDVQVARILVENRLEIIADYCFAQEKVLELSLETKKFYDELYTLQSRGGGVVTREDESATITKLSDSITKFIDSSCVTIISDSSDAIQIPYSRSRLKSEEVHVAEEISRLLVMMHKDRSEIVTIDNIYDMMSFDERTLTFFKVAILPFAPSKKTKRWMLVFRSSQDEDFSTSDKAIMDLLLREVSLFVENAESARGLSDFLFHTARTCTFMVEAKDVYTRGHSERVCFLSAYVGKILNLDRKTFYTLRWAALFHDIGKLNVPEDVLKKPGKLSDKELAMIKEHSTYGAWLLSFIRSFGDIVAAVRHHHERYDGSGYPDGLKGEEIPICARIIAVSDTYDALTSTRCYRKAFHPDEAVKIITTVSGKQLDPGVADVFVAHFSEFAGDIGKANEWIGRTQGSFNWLIT